MNFEFVDNIRLSLEGSNIFLYTVTGAKMCAILLLFFSVLERWGKSAGSSGPNTLNDVLSIVGYVFLIISSDFLFNTVEGTFSSINASMSTVDSSGYTDLLASLNINYDLIIAPANGWVDYLTVILGNITFFIGYILVLVLMGLCKIAEMSMVCGYLLTRIFFLEIMKFLFPIAIALSTIKQTSGLIAKWLRLYIGISILGIVYIAIFKICDIALVELQSAFTNYDGEGFFEGFLGLNVSVWGALITIIIVFSLKVALFNKATSFVINFFN